MTPEQNPLNQLPPVDRSLLAPSMELVPREGQLTSSGEREVGKIVADVWENAEKLVRQELELGLAEIDRRVDKLKVGLISATIGAATLYAGILVLLAALVLGLSNVMQPWLAALIVGGIVTGIGATLSQRGGHKTAEATQPDEHLHRTVRAMKEAVK
jgi:hypothetical protein